MASNSKASQRLAVGYVRMSSDLQKASPKQQRDQIIGLAKKTGFQIVRWYEDAAISGDSTDRRTAFRQMISDASQKNFEKIICWSQDRFGRFDALEAGEWIGPLRRAGVSLLTVTDGEINWDDAIGRLIYTIQQEGKHAFLIDLARNILRGTHQRAKEGRHTQGTIPYGYDKLIFDERGLLVRRISPHEKLCKPLAWTTCLVPSENPSIVRTLRYLFRAYDQGASLRAIVVSLNRRKVPSPRNVYWTSEVIRRMLSNPTYVGDQIWNRGHVGKYAGVIGGEIVAEKAIVEKHGRRKGLRLNHHKDDWIVVPNVHPALISREQFQRVQARLALIVGRTKSVIIDPLKSIVVCGHCGHNLTINHHRFVRKEKVLYYRRLECPTYHRKGRSVCRSRSISQPIMLQIVKTLLKERVVDAAIEERIRASVIGNVDSTDGLVAEAMSQAARFRVALCGNEVDLLCAAVRGLVRRIDLWFGLHLRIRGASKMSRGIIHLREPFLDADSGTNAIEFDRSAFDRASAELPVRIRNVYDK